MSEEWVIVPKYEDYAVSTLGKVKRITDSKTYKSGKILKQNINYAGYADVTLRSNGKPRNFRVNRLVLTAFRGIPADGYEASHIDGDRRNNTLNNLVWETLEDIRVTRRSGLPTSSMSLSRGCIFVDSIALSFYVFGQYRRSNRQL